MLTARERVAALRSKRLAQDGGLLKQSLAAPGNTDNERDVATPPKPKIQGTVDQVNKQAGGSTLSTPIGKLPTPTRRRFRNDPRAMRILWRQHQLRHARKVAVQNAVNSDAYMFMTVPIPDEEKSPVAASIKPDPDKSTFNGSKEQEDDTNDLDDDEEDCDYNVEVDDGEEDQDEEERALESAQQQDLQHDESSTFDAHELSTSRQFADSLSRGNEEEGYANSGDKLPRDSSSDIPASRGLNDTDTESNGQNVGDRPIPKCDVEASQHSLSELDGGTDISPGHSLQKLTGSTDSGKYDVAASSSSPLLPCPLVDREAEEDDKEGCPGELGADEPRVLDDDESLDNADDEDAIVPDERPSKADAIAVASLHRQWELQQEQDQVAAVAACTKRRLVDDFDEAVDLTCVATTTTNITVSDKHEATGGETAEGGENLDSNDANGATRKDPTAEYLEAM